MNVYSGASNQLVEQPAIDRAVLEARGWASSSLSVATDRDLREQLLTLAANLGTPTSSRSGGPVCDTLSPTRAEEAKPRSLSKIYDVGEFPLHTDMAHWVTPCRYVILACVSCGSANRPTLLIDTRRLSLTGRQTSLLHTTPLRVKNGRRSFFSTIFSKGRSFVRFDPGCMQPVTSDGEEALALLTRQNWPDFIETVKWEPHAVIVIDNWRMLHGRAHRHCAGRDRKLLRIAIQ